MSSTAQAGARSPLQRVTASLRYMLEPGKIRELGVNAGEVLGRDVANFRAGTMPGLAQTEQCPDSGNVEAHGAGAADEIQPLHVS